MEPMTNIHEGLSTEALEAEKHARDAEVQRLRAEMREIHKLLEPKWIAQGKATGKPELMQTIGGN